MNVGRGICCLNIEYFRESQQKSNIKVLLDKKIGYILLNFCVMMRSSRQLKQKELSGGKSWQLLGTTGNTCWSELLLPDDKTKRGFLSTAVCH
jgi:hypothetical protein